MTPSAATVPKMPPATAEMNAPDPETLGGSFSAVSNSMLNGKTPKHIFEQI
jgi:hypothetical protein